MIEGMKVETVKNKIIAVSNGKAKTFTFSNEEERQQKFTEATDWAVAALYGTEADDDG